MDAPVNVLECPHCHQSNPAGTSRCNSCGSLFGPVDATATQVIHTDNTLTNAAINTGWQRATGTGEAGAGPASTLQVGSLLAERYEILQLLGEGGVGAVYKARDRELDRLVALKVIRPELAGHASILQRFKQELILARKVTHRNVVRIYDLGVAAGLRFITMEFVEGRDLASLLDERNLLPPEESVKVLRQVCAALEIAHLEGVVHRDLKPQNIMIENGGRVCVMDFGLARSMEATGLTQAGAVLGTPAYMSPEQAKGEPADERSDLFSLGVIAYRMLTGVVPFKADTMLASMLLRTQGPPPAPNQVEPSVPQALSDIVLKMLATNAADRYQSAQQLNADLHDWQEGVLAKRIVTPPMVTMAESQTKKWIGLAVAGAVVLMGAVYGVTRYLQRPAAPVAPMTVLIADFNNHTGDPVFTGTLESTLKLALEGASFISAYDRTRMRDLGLKAVSGTLDETKAEEIAASQGLNVVVSGSIDRRGANYQLSLRALRTVTGKVLATEDATAPDKDQVLFAVTKLGSAVRKALGDSTSETAQRLSMETLSAASLEAVHEYATGLDAISRGKNDEAIQHLTQAVVLDPNFGMAYTALAGATGNAGRRQDADKNIREALNHIDHMTERERFRTRGYFYLLTSDDQRCVDEYSALLDKYPSDTGAINNVAYCSADLRMLKKAVEAEKRAVAILPKRAIYHASLAAYSAFAGDFQLAAKEAAAAAKLDYDRAFVTEGYASLGQGQVEQASEAYAKLQKANPSLGVTALADLAAYEGRFKDAIGLLEKGSADDLSGRTPQPDAAADKLTELAYVQFLRGQKGPALDAAKRALEKSQAVRTRFLNARVYAALGEAAKAQELATGLSRETQLEPQAYGRLIEGEIALQKGDGSGAVKLFTEANGLLDTWIGRFDLGRGYLETGAFPQADSEFDLCLRRRGEALSLFLDPVPTYSYFPLVYYYQGRAREGMKTAAFAESYKMYLSIRSKAGEDPLLAEVRRRAGQ